MMQDQEGASRQLKRQRDKGAGAQRSLYHKFRDCGDAGACLYGGAHRLVRRQFENDMQRAWQDASGGQRRFEFRARAGAQFAQHPIAFDEVPLGQALFLRPGMAGAGDDGQLVLIDRVL